MSALTDFRGSMAIAQSLLTLEATYPDPPSPQDTVVIQGLRGGATVLMVAAFEDFLKAVFEEHLSRLDGAPPPAPLSALPDEIQVTSMFASLNRALSGPRYSETTRVQRLTDIRSAAQRLSDDRLDAVAMSEIGNNPNAKNVKGLFKSVGVSGIFGVLTPKYEARRGPIARTYLADRLDQIVRNRHVVAHTGSALNISRKDLADCIAFIELLGELVDAEIAQRIQSLLLGVTAQTQAAAPPLPSVVSSRAAASGTQGGGHPTGPSGVAQMARRLRELWRRR